MTNPRITGNWWRESDPREVVANAWPELEKYLTKEAFHFEPERISPTNVQRELSQNIGVYRNNKVEQMRLFEEEPISTRGKKALQEMEQDLLKSRSEFLEKVGAFSYNELTTARTLSGVPIMTSTYTTFIRLYYNYRDSAGNYVSFKISPGRGNFSCKQYVGAYSDRKNREKNQAAVERMTDASKLIVEVNARDEITREIKDLYRKIRGK